MASLISQNIATTTLLVILVAMFPTTKSICSDLMASSLSSSGFTVFAHALHSHNISATAAAATTKLLTFLAPPDTALVNRPFNNDSLHGHITDAGALSYQSLLVLAPNTTLPTLHNNTTLVVGTDGKRVSFNDVLVVVPNLYIDGSCVVHGVDGPLVPTPELEVEPSPEVSDKREAYQFSKYGRFNRRSNHSSSDGNESGEET